MKHISVMHSLILYFVLRDDGLEGPKHAGNNNVCHLVSPCSRPHRPRGRVEV